jgi:hypothetical protein
VSWHRAKGTLQFLYLSCTQFFLLALKFHLRTIGNW